MSETVFLEFHLRFERLLDGLSVTAIQTPFGEFSQPFRPPEFIGLGQDIPAGPRREGIAAYPEDTPELLTALPGSPTEAQQAGQSLFAAIFQGEMLALLRRSQDLARQKHAGLRLVLRFGSLPELAELPWEYLFDPRDNTHLALSGKFSIARYIEAPFAAETLPPAKPLNILVFIAGPADLEALDAQAEWQALQTALDGLVRDGRVHLDCVPAATSRRLRQALRRQDFHILHYIGHGTQGQLLLEDQDRASQPLPTAQLGELLGSERGSLGLVVLNACRSAQVAAGLVQSLGLPAAVANLAPVADQAAQVMAGELYAALADGLSIEDALGQARHAVRDTGSSAWGLPALFLHTRTPGALSPEEEEMDQDEKKDSRQVHIGQGSYFEGDINTGGGDFVLGDKVSGDKVMGDKVSGHKAGGNVTIATQGGIAIGGNASNNILNVSQVQQSGASLEAFTALLKELRSALDQAGLDADTRESLHDDLDKVEKQAANPTPKAPIIQSKLKSVVELLTTAAAGAGAIQTILPMAEKALQWAAQLFH